MKKMILTVALAMVSIGASAQTANSVAQTSTSTATAATTTAPAATSTANVEVAKPKKWGISYFNYMNGPALAESANGMSINHYLSLKHTFESKWAASFTLRPDSNFENGEEKQTVMADPYIRIAYPTLYESAAGLKVNGNFNYIIPSSEASKDANSNGAIITRFSVAQDVGAWSFLYLLIPKYNMYSIKEDGQTVFSHGHYITASYTVNSFLAIDAAVYPAWSYKRNARSKFNDLLAYPGVTMSFTKDLSLSPYIEVPLMKAEQRNSSVGASLSYTLL